MHAGGAGLPHALGKMLPGQMLLLQDTAFGALCNMSCQKH